MRKKFVAILMVLFAIQGLLNGAADLGSSIFSIPINVVIPAYNEQERIGPMLKSYCDYFKDFNVHLTVVLNGITDNTKAVVEAEKGLFPEKISIMESQKGKGSAIKAGFLEALKGSYQLIGFVDADGSIAPDQYYYKLIYDLLSEFHKYDGIIASRYMKGSDIGQPRPAIKRYGRELFYNARIERVLGLAYKDYQCGAKLFKHKVIQEIAPLITEFGWAIDLDILYLCKQRGFAIKEVPIVWRDKPGSHLSIISSGKDLYKAINRIKKRKFNPDFAQMANNV